MVWVNTSLSQLQPLIISPYHADYYKDYLR